MLLPTVYRCPGFGFLQERDIYIHLHEQTDSRIHYYYSYAVYIGNHFLRDKFSGA